MQIQRLPVVHVWEAAGFRAGGAARAACRLTAACCHGIPAVVRSVPGADVGRLPHPSRVISYVPYLCYCCTFPMMNEPVTAFPEVSF